VTTRIARSVADLRKQVATWRAEGRSVALVPTMGALHAGHVELMRQGFAHADRVVASIFVNPSQFGPSEDFAAYPRREAADLDKLQAVGVDLLFAPTVEAMYPPGFATRVSVSGLSAGLCGEKRPVHFDGVATVVAKLLLQCQPDVALFGEKDYQQLTIIRRLARDLDIMVEIIGVPTVRESDGLAMSSRNAYLSEGERALAPLLYRTLSAIADRLAAGEGPVGQLTVAGVAALLAGGFASVDYLQLCDAEDLRPLDTLDRPARLLAAAILGRARLIDNVAVPFDGDGR
jgi:pantoate--beta-alanine ligase